MTAIRQEIQKPIEWIKFLISALVISVLLAIIIPLTYRIGEETYTPRDYWFTYHSVKPTKQIFSIGEKLTFYSAREVRKTIDVKWQDKLFCDTNGIAGVGMRVVSIYESSSTLHPHSLSSPGAPWTYQAEKPAASAICYLESTTTAILKYANKVQTIKSERFEIR